MHAFPYNGTSEVNRHRHIIRFLRQLPKSVTDLYVCCSKGGSRSPAVAAAVLRMSGRSDKAVWDNPYYVPNWLVYQSLVKNGGVSEYERWQIIE